MKLLRQETDHEVSKDTLYVLCHICLVSLVFCLSEATTQIKGSGKNRGALIVREADNMLWMVDKLIRKKYNKEISKDHKVLRSWVKLSTWCLTKLTRCLLLGGEVYLRNKVTVAARAFADNWKRHNQSFPPWRKESAEEESLDVTAGWSEREEAADDHTILVQNFEDEAHYYDYQVVYSASYIMESFFLWMQQIESTGRGVLVYLRGYEGRGVGLRWSEGIWISHCVKSPSVEMLIPFDFPEISSPESVPSPAHTTVDEMTRSHSEWASRGFSRRCPVPIKPTTQSISQLPPRFSCATFLDAQRNLKVWFWIQRFVPTSHEVATDYSHAKEKLVVVKTELEAERLDSKEWEEKHKEARKEAELLKNTSEKLRIEADESLLIWNGKEGEDEKSSLLGENNRLLVALDACESLSKKSKDENLKISDILKPARSEANVAEEAVSRAENSNQADALLDKEEELQFALKEIERVKINEVVANDNLMKLKKLLSEVEVAMEEEKHKSLSRQESMLKEVEVKVLRVLITEVETFEFGEVDVAEGENVVLENSCASLVERLVFFACYCDLSVDTRDHTFNLITDILVGCLVCSKELSMYNGELQLVQVKRNICVAFHVQSILMHRASIEQIDVTVVRVRSPTFAVAQHGNSTVAPDFTIHSVHAMEFIDSHSLSEFVDYVSLLSCEVTKGDITSFSSLNSRDGFKNEISIAGDLKNPIIIDQNYCDKDKSEQQESAVRVNNVVYRNISGTSATDVARLIEEYSFTHFLTSLLALLLHCCCRWRRRCGDRGGSSINAATGLSLDPTFDVVVSGSRAKMLAKTDKMVMTANTTTSVSIERCDSAGLGEVGPRIWWLAWLWYPFEHPVLS
ncbi:hypothetical protein HID58_060782 [Brassica napus]|uniref:Uncharacterized protein n=1 Tax=Brassica napus TaxID=3708 RepID=A0ABQ7ZWP0_BRANA|nr:hypothetical protein HID58_060782 [Brassica napus]